MSDTVAAAAAQVCSMRFSSSSPPSCDCMFLMWCKRDVLFLRLGLRHATCESPFSSPPIFLLQNSGSDMLMVTHVSPCRKFFFCPWWWHTHTRRCLLNTFATTTTTSGQVLLLLLCLCCWEPKVTENGTNDDVHRLRSERPVLGTWTHTGKQFSGAIFRETRWLVLSKAIHPSPQTQISSPGMRRCKRTCGHHDPGQQDPGNGLSAPHETSGRAWVWEGEFLDLIFENDNWHFS